MISVGNRSTFAPRLWTAALIIFATWVSAFFIGLYQWFATQSNPRVVTDVELHSGSLHVGYDAAFVALTALILIGRRFLRQQSALPDALGIAIGVALGIGMLYYGAGFLDRFLPSPFGGEWWAQKSSAAYAAIVLALLTMATTATRIRTSSRVDK